MDYFRQSLLVVFFILIFPATALFGQYDLCGKVFVDKIAQEGVQVRVLTANQGAITDEQGAYCFKNLKKDTYLLLVNYFGNQSDTISIDLTKSVRDFDIWVESPIVLDGVEVVSQKRTEIRASHSIKTEVIDLDKYKRSSISVEHLMNNTSGIKVRSDGAVGDDANIVVGGFNGKSVRFLIDGIPVDYLGSSIGVTKIPTNMAHHVEVYKGVMPTEIGVDALGAAINIVTRQPYNTSHQVSYEISSYNSHRLSVNSFIRHSDKLSFGVNAFATYASNNFKVDDLPFEDPETGKTVYITAPLFNNGYRQYSGDIYLNFEKRKWADLFKITLNSFALKRELQNDFTSRSRPYGQAHRKEHAYVVPSIHYKKNLFDNKLSLDQFLVFSSIDYALVDSVRNGYYDWLGERHEAVSGSEMGTDLSYLTEPIIHTRINNLTYRGLFTYRFNAKHKLVLNLIENYLYRIADDLSEFDSKTFITYNRIIAGLGYQFSLLDDQLEGLSQIKYLGSQTMGEIKDILYSKGESTDSERGVALNNGFSVAQSIKYEAKYGVMFRASVENTYRLPDQLEIFGDNVFITPNLSLNPEKSFNVNGSIGYKHPKWFRAEVSAYYRNTKDMIRLKDLTQFSAQYLNLDHVTGYGIELDVAVFPVKNLEISGNLTYNEFRFRGSSDELAQDKHFIDARVSNMPFYFGNARVSYQFDRVFTKKEKLNIYYSYSYVHQYYLDFIEKQHEPDGFLGLFGHSKIFTDRMIPIQHVHSAGLVWWITLPKERVLSLGVEARNFLDAKIYNNFRIQSMGRSFSAKVSFEF